VGEWSLLTWFWKKIKSSSNDGAGHGGLPLFRFFLLCLFFSLFSCSVLFCVLRLFFLCLSLPSLWLFFCSYSPRFCYSSSVFFIFFVPGLFSRFALPCFSLFFPLFLWFWKLVLGKKQGNDGLLPWCLSVFPCSGRKRWQ